MELLLLSLFLGLVPTALYALFVGRINRWSRKPFALLVGAFLWGAIPAVILSIVSQKILNMPAGQFGPLFASAWSMCFSAPLTEELFKGLGMLIIFLAFRREIDSVLDGAIFGGVIGLGFAAVENVLYFSGQSSVGSLLTLFAMRTLLFGFLHAIFTGMTGAGFAMARFSKTSWGKALWPALGIFSGVVIHTFHNGFCTVGGNYLVLAVLGYVWGLGFFVSLAVIGLKGSRACLVEHLEEEVEDGALSSRQFRDATSFWNRSSLTVFRVGVEGYFRRNRLYRNASRLAFLKDHRRHAVNERERAELEAAIERVRALVRECGVAERTRPVAVTVSRPFIAPPPLPRVPALFPPPLPRTA